MLDVPGSDLGPDTDHFVVFLSPPPLKVVPVTTLKEAMEYSSHIRVNDRVAKKINTVHCTLKVR
jgi:hypothetical protein